MNTTRVEQLLHAAGGLLEDAQSLIVRAKPPEGGADRLRVVLVLTIAEQFEAALRLARADMSTHASIHVRSMIEALVAMKMLASDSSYVDKMTFERLKGEQRVYKGILGDPNIPDPMKEPIKERFDACQVEIDSFRAAGHKPKHITEHFGLAGLAHLVGPYSMLCGFSHNDLAAIAFRHLGDNRIIYKKGDDPKFVEAIVTTAVQVIMDAVHQFGEIAKFPDELFTDMFLEMNEKWRMIIGTVGAQ